MRIQYRHPRIYHFLISFLYPKSLLDCLRKEIGMGKKVFEVAAGYGRLSRYIDASNNYQGIDLNPIFVRYGKRRGVNLRLGDILDAASYTITHDVVLVVDVVHHLTEQKLQRLFDFVFRYAKEKVIIIEPSFIHIVGRWGFLGKILGWIFRFIDSDGFNTIQKWFTHGEYEELFINRFRSVYGRDFSFVYTTLGGHYFVTFERQTRGIT